jgi:colanic acid/amylovoran biosynthesis glycosyltransferase
MANKKTVLFFVPTFPVMSETFIERELCELKSRGNINVQIAAFKKGSELNCKELSDNVDYLGLGYKDLFSALVTFATENPIVLWRTRTLLKHNKNKNYFANFYLWLKSVGYAYLLSKKKFDQIHAHFLSDPSTIALVAAMLLDKPLSLSGHARDVFGEDGGPELIPEKLRYAKFAALCNKKAYVHCVNLAGTKDKNKSYLMPHGVDTDTILSSTQNSVTHLYFIGRFVEKKGLSYLVEAAKILKERGEKFILQLGGYGPLLKEIKSLVEKLNLNNEVVFLNEGKGLNSETALKYMYESDIFVMPSIDLDNGDSDGVPNNILEAGTFAKPVVTTDAGSILEVVKNGENGIVVKQRDSQGLADAMQKLMDDKNLAGKLGSNLNKFVKEHYDIKKNIIDLEKLLLK